MISLDDGISLDPAELTFTASRSSGPGGQNVNKVSTRVTVSLDIASSRSLKPEHRARLLGKLKGRLTKAGVLSVSSQRERTQGANRRAAEARLVEILQEALEVPAERRPTRVPRSAKRRRLTNKRQRSQLKKERGTRYRSDD
ncbi:MAG: alternative ribosome rescue aminoacyl-tRNA hydrolase ArfB [Acidobacteriota bacterium]